MTQPPDEPLGQPPYRPPVPQPQFIPAPPLPPPVVEGRGFNGPYAWVYITALIVGVFVILPLTCCLGLMLVGYSNT